MNLAENWLDILRDWAEFYLLVGTAGAALTGLLFVVVSLGPHVIARRGEGARTFITPMVVHFTSVVVLSALMLVPHTTPGSLALLLALGSIAILAYIAVIGVHRQWRRSHLDLPDWFGYVGLPILSYLIFLGAALALWRGSWLGLNAIAAGAILLLAVSIRNAWDLILWMAQQSR